MASFERSIDEHSKHNGTSSSPLSVENVNPYWLHSMMYFLLGLSLLFPIKLKLCSTSASVAGFFHTTNWPMMVLARHWNYKARDHFQCLHGPSGGCGSPVENPWYYGLIDIHLLLTLLILIFDWTVMYPITAALHPTLHVFILYVTTCLNSSVVTILEFLILIAWKIGIFKFFSMPKWNITQH